MITSTDGRRRRPGPVPGLLIVAALAVVVGEAWYLVARATMSTAQTSGGMPTLPVHVYAQYTQRMAAVDTSGLWTGLAIAGLGLVVLLAAAVVAIRRPRVD